MPKGLVRISSIMLVMILLAALLPLTGQAAGANDRYPEMGEYIQIEYNTEDGLSSNEANTVLYTSNGYIWVGSYNGLSRYDSNSFVNYGSEEGCLLNGVSVRTLYEDDKGRLWIGSNEKGVYILENGQFSEIDTSPAGALNSIRAFAQTEDGMYIASTGGMALVSEDMTVSPVNIENIVAATVAHMKTDSRGRLWVIDNDSVVVLDDREIMFSADIRQYTDNECQCIGELSDGTVIVGTSGTEIIEFREKLNSFSVQVNDLKECTTINCIYEDLNGRIWICSDSGLGYLDDNEKYHHADEVDITSLECIVSDYEGDLWMASSRHGVMELVRGSFNNSSRSTELAGQTVNATQGYEGYIFVATDTGVKVVDPETSECVDHVIDDLLDGIRTRGLFVDSSGYLWITTYQDYGVIRYKNGKYVSINTDDGLTSNKTRVSMELDNGDIAVSTGGGVSIIRGTEVIKTYTEADGLENPVILALCKDRKGNMYFGSDGNGIYVVAPDGTITSKTVADGLGSDVILNLKYDEKLDAIWICTGSSLAVWDKDGIRNLGDFTAGVGSLFDMVFPNSEDIWILRSGAIVIATRDLLLNGAPAADYTVLDSKNGLSDITSNSRHYIDEDGVLYIATADGVYTIDTGNIYTNEVAPRAIINSVSVDGVVYSNPDRLVISSDANRISIEFSALCYSTRECVVEYQLKGADKEPMTATSEKTIYCDYTNLRGGSYVFTVKVISPSGVPSESAVSLHIEKKLAFHETAYFIIGAMLAAILTISLVVYFAVKIRTASLVKQQERYRSLTESALRVAARSIDAKDNYTNGHSFRVAVCAREIARRIGYTDEQIEAVYYSALVHDIGKIGVPDSLLTKPSELTKEEYDIIRRHTETGYQILEEFEGQPGIGLGALFHHERYDGNGYMSGLKGEDIPQVARIIAVADAYDAMASSRVYRPRLDPERIRSELIEGKGTQFDPELADIMLQLLDEGFDPEEE